MVAAKGNIHDFAKEFYGSRNWEDFLKRWHVIRGEQEAIGLLYGGANVPYAGSYAKSAEILERINFYLDCTNYRNEKIAEIAREILIKQWLKQLRGLSMGDNNGCLEITNRILEFLQNPKESLLKPPYPRFVSEYLLPLHKEWKQGSISGLAINLRGSTKLIIKAICAWRLGYVLAEDGLRPETIPIIKEFLDERGYQAGRVFMKISGYGEPPADLSGGAGREEICYTAACAFLKLKYWVGGGFTAEFIRALPPIDLVTDAPKKIRAPIGFPKSFAWEKVPNNSYICWCKTCNELWMVDNMFNDDIQGVFGRIKETFLEHTKTCPCKDRHIYQVFDGKVIKVEDPSFIIGN